MMAMADLREFPDYARRAADEATRRAQEVSRLAALGERPSWYVVRALSDARALEWLGRFHFETYYPHTKVARKIPLRQQSHKQRRAMFPPTRMVDDPTFPGYIFVHFDPAGRAWHDQFKTAGVGGMLCHGNIPAPVPDSEIARLRGSEIEGDIPGATPARFIIPDGALVRILDGSFAGHNAAVDGGIDVPIGDLAADARIRVLASLFGRQTPVELEISQIAVL